MKKIITFLFALMLVVSMAVPAFAVTTDLGIPNVPEIPDISDDIEIELPEGIFDDYIPDIDIDIEIELPTEPPAEEKPEPPCFNYCDMLKGWIKWWMGLIRWP